MTATLRIAFSALSAPTHATMELREDWRDAQ